MPFELDHLFICTSVEAPQGDRLIEFGLTEGPRNSHPGQGTANRRFFFHNGMIELLWLRNELEAKTELVTPTRLYERCKYQETAASPFGLILRPTRQDETGFPFIVWEYHPPYLAENLSFYVAENSKVKEEPFLAYMPFRVGAEEYLARCKPYLDHAIRFKEITQVRITMPETQPHSAALRAVAESGCVSFTAGESHLIEIGFDGCSQGQSVDFRPDLPLIFHW